MIHLSEIDLIIIETTAAYISTYLLAQLAEQKIPVITCDLKHNPVGQYVPLYGAHDSAKRIKEQVSWDKDVSSFVWRNIVISKINNQARVLERLGLAEALMLREYADHVEPGDKTNREGHAAKVYFNALFGKGFTRDLDCSINALLNYGYAILLGWVNREITVRGYLTQLGISHCNEYNHFNLGCDFMEPFRPAIDQFVVDHMESELDKETKIELLELFDQYYETVGGNYRLSSIIGHSVKSNFAILAQRADLSSYFEFDLDEG